MMCFSCRVTSDAKVVFLDVIPTPQDIISDFSYIPVCFRKTGDICVCSSAGSFFCGCKYFQIHFVRSQTL